MKRPWRYLLCVLGLTLPHWSAFAAIPCQIQVPRCYQSTCGGGIGPEDYQAFNAFDVGVSMLPGTHKSPAYSSCPSSGGLSTCTDDRFRGGDYFGWDYVAQNADYMYLWYATNPVSAPGAGEVVYDQGLRALLGQSQFDAITSIDYVDIDVGWSTYNPQTIELDYGDAASGGNGTDTGQRTTGDYPNGTLSYWRLTTDPFTGQPWTKDKFADYRDWWILNGNAIDGAHPGGLFLHSITETVGFEFNGSSCPVPPAIIR